MSWLTFVLLALVLIFAVQGFRKGMLRMAISMVFFLMVLGVTSWLNPYISDFVREKTTWQISIEEKCNEVLLEQLEGRDDLQSITGQVSYIEELPLPQTVKDKLMENNNTEIYKRLAVESFADYLGKYLSYGIINGICFLISFAIATILMSGNTYGYHMTRMVAAIIISFGCYLPVTLFSKTKPKVGLLMIPKTCAYMWVIAMGLQLLF